MKPVNSLGAVANSATIEIDSRSQAQLTKPTENRRITSDALSDTTLTPFTFMGVKVSGIDPSKITSASLEVEVPLKTGKHIIEGLTHNINVTVRPGSKSLLVINVQKDNEGKLRATGLSLHFSRAITITNPSAAFLNKQGILSLVTKVTDSIAHLQLKSAEVHEEGRLFIDGEIKVFKLMKKSLKREIETIGLPDIDQSLLSEFGLLENRQNNSLTKSGIDLAKLLSGIGGITENATYNLEIHGDSDRLAFMRNNDLLTTPKKSLDIKLSGLINLNKCGDLFITVEGAKSHVKFSLGEFTPEIRAVVSNIGSNKPIEVDMIGKVKGTSTDVEFNRFSRDPLKRVLSREQGKQEILKAGEYATSVGVKKTTIDADFTLSANLKTGDEQIVATSDIKLGATGIEAKTFERGVKIDGEVTTHITSEHLHFSNQSGITGSEASIAFTYKPSKEVLDVHPEIASVDFDYEVKITGDDQARIVPPEHGFTRVIRPIINYDGHFERINGSSSKGEVFTIGSAEYFEQVSKITGSKIRQAHNVKLLIDGNQSFPVRLKLIREARKSICFQALEFKDDHSGWEYAKALVAAKERGVKVYGIVDSLGNIAGLQALKNPNRIYQFLKENGIDFHVHNSQLEEGLRSIFKIVQENPKAFTSEIPAKLSPFAPFIKFLDDVARVADDGSLYLSKDTQEELKHGIHAMLFGRPNTLPQNSVNELRKALKEPLMSMADMFSMLKRMGGLSFLWHEKYLIADGQKAVLGGMNIADQYLLGGTNQPVMAKGKVQPAWRDTDVYFEGEAVIDAYQAFRRNFHSVSDTWLEEPQEDLEFTPHGTHCPVSILQHQPVLDGDHNILNFLLYNLRTLKKGEKAWFESAYFLPRGALRALQKELVEAAKRGVDVRILTNSYTTSDFGALVKAAVFDYRELLEAGAKIYERSHDRTVHAKVTVLGDTLTMVGSWNCDNRSEAHDSEDVVVMYDPSLTKEMVNQLIIDMEEQSTPVKLDDIKSQKLYDEINSAAMLLAGELL